MTCHDCVANFARFWRTRRNGKVRPGELEEGQGRTKLLWPDIVRAGRRTQTSK